MISIDLDGQTPDRYSALADSTFHLTPAESGSAGSGKPLTSPESFSSGSSSASKKLSIVLSKDMHRRAKMQALKEDVTLKRLVLRLLEQHLDQQGTL
ncbi:hypothetical protein [Synechococcus sp. KORDI-52]|uniref:hypothetical protein n=1 Tax=Synechococcus sp. KORDI-52 TaxID=585425 RepID=UPI000ACEA649|nr:hypothetical protein [Synechococcus sp. KORDI-52]